MIKLPAKEDGRWTVQYASDKLPDLIQTKNLTFDKEGYIKLSKPSIAYYNSDDDADFGMPVGYGRWQNNMYMVATDDRSFFVNMEAGQFYAAKDTSTDAPQGVAGDTHATIFNNELVISNGSGDLVRWDFDFDWTVSSVVAAGNNNPLANFVSENELAVTDAVNEVEQYSTSYVAGTKLTLPSSHRVACFAYNRNYLGIVTYDGRWQGNAYFYVWDGKTSAANSSYPINTNTGFTVIPYGDTFHIATGNNQVWRWTGSSLEPLVNFPAYYDTGVQNTQYQTGGGHGDGYVVDGDIYMLNMSGGLQESDSKNRVYTQGQPSGMYCYDPAVGMYHRHGTTATTMITDSLNEGAVNTADDEITVAAAPDTGTPVYYSSGGDTEIGGLSTGSLYYTIKVDATTIQLATTYANAIASTAISLTSDITDPVVLTSAVNTGTDRIAISADILGGYGKPVVYNANGGTEIGGLSDGTTYYITGDSDLSSFQLSTTVALALEYDGSNDIDLTGTGNDLQTFSVNAHTLSFIPKSDFGQQFTQSRQGCVNIYDRTKTTLGEGRSVGAGYLWGARVGDTDTTEKYAGGMTLRGTENRGYFVTSRIMSRQMQEDWQKLFLKHNKLSGEFDEIHLKYRIREEDLVKVGYEDDGTTISGSITWSDSDTFTSTDTQYADVKTQVDAGNDVEIEVVQGAGSGYLLHVDSITEAGGTYTVNLKESVKNISASDTARAIASRWNYLTKIDSDTTQNDDGYSEIAVGVKSKAIQFKVELRGEDVEVEEILIANTLHKPVA